MTRPTTAARPIQKATLRNAAAWSAAPMNLVTVLTILPSSRMPSSGSKPWTTASTMLAIVQPGEMLQTSRKVGPKRRAPLTLKRVSSSLSPSLLPEESAGEADRPRQVVQARQARRDATGLPVARARREDAGHEVTRHQDGPVEGQRLPDDATESVVGRRLEAPREHALAGEARQARRQRVAGDTRVHRRGQRAPGHVTREDAADRDSAAGTRAGWRVRAGASSPRAPPRPPRRPGRPRARARSSDGCERRERT